MSRTVHRLRVVEAAMALSVVGVMLAVLPFRIVARLAGRVEPSGQACPPPTADAAASAVGRAVEAAARRLPWRPACLAQALTASLMLRRRGVPSHLCIGVAAGEGRGFEAHAWLTAAGGTVCGGAAAEGFTPIAAFRPTTHP